MAPMTISMSPINERATCGGSWNPSADADAALRLAREAVLEPVERLARVATGLAAGALDLDHDRKYHRSSSGALEQVLREAVLDLGFEQARLTGVIARIGDGRADPVGGGRDHWVVRAGNEAVSDDLRAADEVACLLVD